MRPRIGAREPAPKGTARHGGRRCVLQPRWRHRAASAVTSRMQAGAGWMADIGLRLERDGAIAAIVLARPERQNAIATAMWQALAGHCDELARDPGVRVVVVRGEGSAFSAGADIGEFAQVFADRAAAHDYNELVQDALGRLEQLPMPTIAQLAATASAAAARWPSAATCASRPRTRGWASRRRGWASPTAWATCGASPASSDRRAPRNSCSRPVWWPPRRPCGWGWSTGCWQHRNSRARCRAMPARYVPCPGTRSD